MHPPKLHRFQRLDHSLWFSINREANNLYEMRPPQLTNKLKENLRFILINYCLRNDRVVFTFLSNHIHLQEPIEQPLIRRCEQLQHT